jgi:hypothetical protein
MLRMIDSQASVRARVLRGLGLAAMAVLMVSAGTMRSAEAVTLINPATVPATKAATDDGIIQVRHGGGGHGGHFHGGGFRGGHIGGFHGGGFRAAPVYRAHVGGYRYGGFRHYGIYRPHYRHHFHRRFYYGGYYPYYHYPRRCRIIWTYYGPRRVCRWPRWHYPYRYW